MSMSVCYLPVHKHFSATTCPNFIKFFTLVTHDRGSVFLWRRCDALCLHIIMVVIGDAKKAYAQTDATDVDTDSSSRRVLELAHQRAAPRRIFTTD